MKIKRTKQTLITIVEKTLCDACTEEIGAQLPNQYECTLNFREGIGYSDGSGWGKSREYDFCPECFRRLIDLAEREFKCNLQPKEYDH